MDHLYFNSHLQFMAQSTDPEGKLVSMIMEGIEYARFAAVCDKEGNILWNSQRNDVDNILTMDETKASLKRSIELGENEKVYLKKLVKEDMLLLDMTKSRESQFHFIMDICYLSV